MNQSEFEKQNKRIKNYKEAQDRISILKRKKADVAKGISSINCIFEYGRIKTIDFDYFDDDFEDRLTNNILQFLDSEIEDIKRYMENI